MSTYDNCMVYASNATYDPVDDPGRGTHRGVSPEDLVNVLLMCPNIGSLGVHIVPMAAW